MGRKKAPTKKTTTTKAPSKGACPRCGAKGDAPCTTTTGAPYSKGTVHSGRPGAVQDGRRAVLPALLAEPKAASKKKATRKAKRTRKAKAPETPVTE